jgi:glutamine cyclotransferase
MKKRSYKKDLEKLKTEGFIYYLNEGWKMTEKGQNLILGADEAGRLSNFIG